MRKKVYITDYVGLDLLRFILSMAVVLVHYHAMFYEFGPHGTEQILHPTPFGAPLAFIFKYGPIAVPIFWMISGLIFYSVYVDQISEGKVSFREFSILRLTRLYPLHFLTFLMVAIMGGIYYNSHHAILWFQDFDAKHFLLQFLFMGSWYPNFKNSFNVPTWSVSLEIFVYIAFFVLAKVGALKNKGLYWVFSAAFVFEIFDILNPFHRCLVFFFAGCILVKHLRETDNIVKVILQCGTMLVLSGVFLVMMKKLEPGMTPRNYQTVLDIVLMPLASVAILTFILAFKNLKNKIVIKGFKTVGDMTYSTYLIHYPIQVIIILLFHPQDSTPFDSPIVLTAFLATTCVAGYLLFHFFEKPVQNLLRKKLLSKEAKTEQVEQTVAVNTQATHVAS